MQGGDTIKNFGFRSEIAQASSSGFNCQKVITLGEVHGTLRISTQPPAIGKKTRGGEKTSIKSSCSKTISTSSDISESEPLTKSDLGWKDFAGNEVTSNRLGRSPSESVCINARDDLPALLCLAISTSMRRECFSGAPVCQVGRLRIMA